MLQSFLLPCLEGIEPEVAADALDLGARSAAPMRGRVLVEADASFLYAANLAHPTASRVLLVLAEGVVASLQDVASLVASVAWESIFGLDRSFGASCVRVGEHGFTSFEVARAAGDAVIARFRAATGARPPVNLNAPDVEVGVHVRDDRAYVCVDTTGPGLHQRPWRVYQPKAPLPAPLASALVHMSGWREGLLFDPACGSGTIPIEADFRARGRAPNLARSAWAFQRLKLHDEARFEEARDALACRALDEGPPVVGSERHDRDAEGARANAASAGARVEVWSRDFNLVPRPEGMTALVANPPWGLRIAGREASDRIGARLRAKMAEWAEGGAYTAVVIVGNQRFEKGEPHPDEARDVRVGGAACRILTYRLG